MMNIFSKYRVSPWVRNLQPSGSWTCQKRIIQSTLFMGLWNSPTRPWSNLYNSWTWLYIPYKGKRFDETGILDEIKCHTKRHKLDNFYTDLHHVHATHNPSSTVLLRGEIIRNANIKTILTHLSKKKDFFMEKLSARGYNPQQYLWSSRPNTTPILAWSMNISY